MQWEAKRFDESQIVVLGPGSKRRELIATCTGENKERNSRQIALLPELLEAIDALLHAHRHGRDYEIAGKHPVDGHPLNAMGMACVQADAIVAKAKGEE